MGRGTGVGFVVVAAGRGLRIGKDLPKQYHVIAGRPLLAWTIDALAAAAPGAPVLTVIHGDDRDLYDAAIAHLGEDVMSRLLPPVAGGATRQASVRAGLEALGTAANAPELVLIHDAARPLVSKALVTRAIEAAGKFGAAVPGTPVSDTIKLVDDDASVASTPDRSRLRAVQTPQAFDFRTILEAHRSAFAAGQDGLSDDAAVAEWAGHKIHIFAGETDNMKITNPADIATAESRLSPALDDIRTGQGFDVHAFCPGDHVWLGGVQVPHSHGLEGHSDADVLMHAITDAILGAIADGDIGSHFPPSDPQWKGAASDIFLRHAVGLVTGRGGKLAHVDGTVICEAPRVGPHRDAIRARLAEIMGLSLDRVAIKATTSEKLGFTGRREGIAAMAIATVRLPS